MENVEVLVDNKFEEILRKEAEDFNIDWSLVDIKWVLYEQLLLDHLKPHLGEKMVKMVVLGFRGEIPVPDIDDWFRSHLFTYLREVSG